MKYPTLLLLVVASFVAAESAAQPVMVSAAKTKPSNPWQDYPTRLVSSLPGYQSTTDGAHSTYGGIKSDRHAATGFFHAEKNGARWWLIDPEGYRFIHIGVVDVKHPKSSGTPQGWATAVRAHSLSRLARQMRLGEYLLLGRGEEETGGRLPWASAGL